MWRSSWRERRPDRRPLDPGPRPHDADAGRDRLSECARHVRGARRLVGSRGSPTRGRGRRPRRPRRVDLRQRSGARRPPLRLREARRRPRAAQLAARAGRDPLRAGRRRPAGAGRRGRARRARRRDREHGSPPGLRGARRGRGRSAGGRGRRRRSPLPHLHVGHDREAEGRRPHAREHVLDEPLLRPHVPDGRPRDRAAGASPVPHRRLERAVAARLVGGRDGRARAGVRRGARARADRREAGDDDDGRPRHLPLHGGGALLRERRPLEPAPRGRRRRADAREPARDLEGARRRDRAGLRAHRGGAERPLPAARGRVAQGSASPASRTRTSTSRCATS